MLRRSNHWRSSDFLADGEVKPSGRSSSRALRGMQLQDLINYWPRRLRSIYRQLTDSQVSKRNRLVLAACYVHMVLLVIGDTQNRFKLQERAAVGSAVPIHKLPISIGASVTQNE